MKFSDKLKKHYFTKPKVSDSIYEWVRLNNSNEYTRQEWQNRLIDKINEVSAQIHESSVRGVGNFIMVGSNVAEVLNEHIEQVQREHDIGTIEMGDFRVEDDTYIQDITVYPRRTVADIQINLTADTWSDTIDTS